MSRVTKAAVEAADRELARAGLAILTKSAEMRAANATETDVARWAELSTKLADAEHGAVVASYAPERRVHQMRAQHLRVSVATTKRHIDLMIRSAAEIAALRQTVTETAQIVDLALFRSETVH